MGVEFPCKNLFGDFLHVDSIADELGFHDNWLYKGKEYFANFVPLDSVGANLQVVLKKKGRSMVKVTRKRKHQYYKKINRFRKVRGKRVSVEAVWHAIINIDHLNGLIEMMEVMKFTLEINDSVWCLREMVKTENKRLLGLNKHLVDAEEDIGAKEGYLQILEEAIYSR
nr:hypothetical protein [Tanacetum cinerariifolium]